jgi:SpoVK/Ycf46/Vps4 family AAA+-type ATPase
VSQLFNPDHYFFKNDILNVDTIEKNEPSLCGAITINPKILKLITSGKKYSPVHNIDFPAIKLETERDWNEKVFDKKTDARLEEVRNWIENAENLRIEWGLKNIIHPGYRCLFHGPPGTGKTLTATLLGKATHRDVYRIDLSGLVSKYVGETIKNLEKVFKQTGNAILFFDEADAMFGKRTRVKDSNDRFANQEVAYLLQKIEVYEGVVILASNLKENLDEAFMRRFESVIYFPMPGEKERQELWKISFPKIKPEDEQALSTFGKRYELSGGNITRAAHFAAMNAYTRLKKMRDTLKSEKSLTIKEKMEIEKQIASPKIKTDEILEAIKREYDKEKKSFPRGDSRYAKAI